MINQAKFRVPAWPIVLALGLLVAVLTTYRTTTAVPAAPEANPVWGNATLLSGTGQDGRKPRIAASPDGSRVLVVYINENDDDPYYTISTNQGQTWPPATKINASIDVSAQVIGAFDGSNKAFAIWVEKITPQLNRLVFASKTGSNNWTSPVIITTSYEIIDPSVFLDQRNTLHLVWVQEQPARVHYAYLTSGSSSWSTPISVENVPGGDSSEPAVVVDRNDRLYLAWSNDAGTFGDEQEVVFSRGTVSGTPAAPVWNPQIQNWPLSPADMPIAAHAVMGASGNNLHIAYTRKIDIPDPTANDKQDIFYATCAMPCDTLDSSDFRTISGALVEVNGSDPSEVVAALAVDSQRGAAYITFSGIVTTLLNPNEVIQGIQSCDGWASGSLPYIIENNPDYRFIKPAMTISQGWMHLVFDRISSDTTHEIFHRRASVSCPATLLLPIIRK
ncbi:MAG: hypothetical protein IPM39_08480 [Chloroflexi bacterium]|nr:hypothetical protein [Chloroflexota bacterium]